MFVLCIREAMTGRAAKAAAITTGVMLASLLPITAGAGQLAQDAEPQPAIPLAVTVRVSLADDEAEGNGASGVEGISTGVSADGRFVAFYSHATNLVPGDINAHPDIFLRDSQAGSTTLVSRAHDGGPANGPSTYPSISADGNYVAFKSNAENIVAGDNDSLQDVFVYNRQTGQNTMIGDNSFGADMPSISGNGRFLAFVTGARLVPTDTNSVGDIYVTDLVSGGFELISMNASNQAGNGHSYWPHISFDGRYVAFESLASNLVPNDTNSYMDVFMRDRVGGSIVLASTGPGGAQGNNRSTNGSVSDDGRYVAFESLASNLVPNDTNNSLDVFVRDLTAGTVRASVTSGGEQGTGHSTEPRISGNGRYVAFQSNAQLAPTDTNFFSDVYLRDLQLSTTEQISVSSTGQPGNSYSHKPEVSPDGQLVVFGSYATNLVAGDTNQQRDVFLRNRELAPSTPTPTPPPGGCTIQFNDVPESNAFYPFIRCLACRGIISGYSDAGNCPSSVGGPPCFRWERNVTRGQLSKIVSEAGGFQEDPSPPVFTDVPSTNPFYTWINRLANRQIISGYNDTTNCPTEVGGPPCFRWEREATRGQISKIVSEAARYTEDPGGQIFADVPTSNPFYTWINRLANRQIISGYNDAATCAGTGTPCFRWERNATRGQTSKIVANTFFQNCQVR